jgi:signal transduction histidine kinase
MQAFRDLSIKWKLMWLATLTTATALVLISAGFVVYEFITFPKVIARKLSIQAQIIGTNSFSALLFNDPRAATETLAALRADPRIVAATIYDRDGRAFAKYIGGDQPQGSGLPERLPDQPEGERVENRQLFLLQHIVADRQRQGTIYIQSDLQELNERIESYAGIAGIVLLVSFLVAVLVAFRLQRSISQPILHLVQTASDVSVKKDYSVRAAAEDRSELGLLVTALNEMLEQIQRRDAELRTARDELELRVIERTEQLESANRGLAAANKELEVFSHQLEEASRLKSEFLANMSHELRTPLNAIIGFSELMQDGRAGPVSDRQKEFLGDVLGSSHHLLLLINDVLDLAKVESGKMEFYPEPVDLPRLVGEARDTFKALTEKNQIRLGVEIDPSLVGVSIDPAKLKQVLYNYLSNAIKFTSKGGSVKLSIRPDGAEAFRLEVEDNGIGIRPEDIGRLFTEFEQLDAGAAKKYQGTGLGLALTRRIVEAQGGRVGVSSEPGQGSTFYAVLPRLARATRPK